MNTHSETFKPLVYRVIDDALLKAMPAIPFTIFDFFVGQFTLEIFLRKISFYANFVVAIGAEAIDLMKYTWVFSISEVRNVRH